MNEVERRRLKADKVSVQRDGLTYAYVEVTAHEDSNP